MTWNRHHGRSSVLRSLVSTLNEADSGLLPWDFPGVAENFTDEADLVGALLLRWNARLGANLDRALSTEPDDLPAAVVSAWRRTAAEHPGILHVVDQCRRDPLTARVETTVLRARDREHARLAAAAGLAAERDPRAARIGARLEERARGGHSAAVPTPPTTTSSPTPSPSSGTAPADRTPHAQEATTMRRSTSTPTPSSTPVPTGEAARPAAPADTSAEDVHHHEVDEDFVRRLKAALAAA